MLNLQLYKRIYTYTFNYKDVDYIADIIVDFYSKTTESKIYYAKDKKLVTGALAPVINLVHGDFIQSALDTHFKPYLTLFD